NGPPNHPLSRPSPVEPPWLSMNDAPSSEVKHFAFARFPFSACTVTTPEPAERRGRPVVAPHRSTATYTSCAGTNAAGRAKGEPLPSAIAPLKWSIPPTFSTAALLVLNGALVQPFCRPSAVNPAADGANDAPSSEVKHFAFSKFPFSACTVTTP